MRLLDHESLNMIEFSKTLNIKDAVYMAARSWDKVDSSTIAKSWKKLLSSESSSTYLDESKECEEIHTILNDIQISAEERSNWLTADINDPGYCEYTEEEIVAIARGDNESQDIDEDEVNSGPSKISHAAACSAMQTVLTYLEQQPSTSMAVVVTVNGLLIEASRKRFII